MGKKWKGIGQSNKTKQFSMYIYQLAGSGTTSFILI